MSGQEDHSPSSPSSSSSSSLLCGCCCSSFQSCRQSRENERLTDVEFQVFSKSHLKNWPLGQAHKGKSFTMPQTQSEMNYALLERWGSQESMSRAPGDYIGTPLSNQDTTL